MAITINSTPEAFPSLHDELYFVATSTNAAATNFKYIFDIKIGGNLVSRLRIFPDPTSDKGICNVGNVVRNYWSSYFNPNTSQTLFSYNGNGNKIDYTIEFGEDINGTVTPNLASGNYSAYNFAPPAFRDYSTSYFQPLLNDYLTNRDKNELTITGSEKLYVSFGVSNPVTAYPATINNGITTSTGSAAGLNSIAILDVSPAAINTYLGSSFITDATQQYSVTINDKIVTVKRQCSRFDTIVLHFLNQLGGYDTMPFRLVNREIRNMERKQYQQNEWRLDTNTMRPYDSYKKRIGGNVQFAVKQKVSYSLNSDYVNATDYNWLKELIASPEVYMERGGYYYPAIVTDNNWTEKKRISDKLFNLAITIELLETNSQYR